LLAGGAELPLLWMAAGTAALAESALQFASWAKLEEDLDGNGARRRYARYLEGGRSLSAFCVLVRIVCSTAFVALVALRAAAEGSVPGAIGAAAALLIFAELLGRVIGRKWSTAALMALLPALYHLSAPLRAAHWRGRHGRGGDAEADEPEVVEAAREEIRVAIEDGTTEGALDEDEKDMIEGILRFGDVRVSEIMTPRTEIESMDADMPLAAAIRTLEGFRHSRIPVRDGTMDDIVGMAYVKDLLTAAQGGGNGVLTLRDVTREPFFIPETKTVSRLLREFQRRHVQIGIVLDEYGGVSGLVTVEDIMEEIVGEIEDEYDAEDHENRIRTGPAGGLDVDARVHIDELNAEFDLGIPEDEDYDTVGGYAAALFGRVPSPGEEMRSDGLLVRILESHQRRVERVLIRRLEEQEP